MGATANDIYRMISDIQNRLIQLRSHLATLKILDSNIEGQEHLPRTGWRWVRGEAGAGTYKRDPNGTDPLPKGYDLHEYDHPGQKRQVEPSDELAERRKAE